MKGSSKMQGRSPMNNCSPPSSIASSIVPLHRAKEMYEEYGSARRVGLIETYENLLPGVSNYEATRFAEFEYEKLKTYMTYLECLNTTLESNEKQGVNTVRLYFTSYPHADNHAGGYPVKTEKVNGNTYSYKGKNTIILAPTTKVEGHNQCFLYKDTPNGIEITSFDNQNNAGYDSPMLNEAGLTPPPPKPVNCYFGQ